MAAPEKLGVKARRLWRAITDEYELTAAELRILEDACREVDLIERMEAEQRDSPLVAKGSMGQPVAAPLVQELRQHRSTLARLLGQLGLNADGSPSSAASEAARAMAARRWGAGGS